MANPKVYDFDYSDWYWDEHKIEWELKTPATVLKAKTLVHKASDGKIETWDCNSSARTGALYILSEDTITDVKTCVCIFHGKVKQSEIILPNGVKWGEKKGDATPFDNMVLRSQIELI